MVNFIAPDTGPTDPDVITADAITFIQNQFPDWEPSDGNLEVWQMMALSRIVSIATTVAGTVPLAIFKYFGQSVIGLPVIGALAATTTTTWTMNDTQGYTIPAGTNVAFATSGNTLVPFETVADVTIPAGSSVTPTGGVVIQAVNVGSSGNGIGPSGLTLTDALSYVASITAVSVTTGGADAETDVQYASRLSSDLQLSTPTPILATEFATMTRNVPGVFRATAVDNYNPGDGTTTNQRMVAVAAVDQTGHTVSSTVKTAIQTYLNSLRETNFIVNVFDPTFTTVNVAFQVTTFAAYDPNSVVTVATAAVANFLNPVTWGVDPLDLSQTSWLNTTLVRYNALIGVLLTTPGVRWVNTLTINTVAGDLTLTGKAPLPTVGTITGTHT